MVLVLDIPLLLVVEPPGMLEQAASKLMRPAPRMILNMMIPRLRDQPPEHPAAKDAAPWRCLPMYTNGNAGWIVGQDAVLHFLDLAVFFLLPFSVLAAFSIASALGAPFSPGEGVDIEPDWRDVTTNQQPTTHLISAQTGEPAMVATTGE